MPAFRIHRMKDAPRQSFLWAPHVSGAASVKPKDYEPAAEVEAENEYAAWAVMRASEKPLEVGDLLETPGGELRLCKYVGFDVASWFIPAPPPQNMPPVAESQAASA